MTGSRRVTCTVISAAKSRRWQPGQRPAAVRAMSGHRQRCDNSRSRCAARQVPAGQSEESPGHAWQLDEASAAVATTSLGQSRQRHEGAGSWGGIATERQPWWQSGGNRAVVTEPRRQCHKAAAEPGQRSSGDAAETAQQGRR